MSSNLTFSFLGDIPRYIQLGDYYKGPKNPKMAEYNSGGGWKPCFTGRDGHRGIILPIHSNQISFRGDWRDENGGYSSMFEFTFTHQRGYRDVIMSGSFEYDANNITRGYADLFCGCDGIVYMRDDPIPKLNGKLAHYMFYGTFSDMKGLTTVPEDFLDMSEMYGDLETIGNVFRDVCSGMSNVSSSHIFRLNPDMKINSNNAYNFKSAWSGMKNWTGTVLWGDKVLFNKIVPSKRVGAVYGCHDMIGYDKIHRNWK